MKWDIRREGRAWQGTEEIERWRLTPDKFETSEGKLFDTDEERLTVLALLLENLGIDKAIRLGDPEKWREAIAELKD